MITLLLATAVAGAACPERSSRMQVGAALGEVTDALEDGDLADARARLEALVPRLPCLDEPMDRALLAVYARQRAIVAYESGDRDDARRWGLLARALDPEHAWTAFRDHPARALADEAAPPPVDRADGGLVAPKGGGVFVNGAFAAWPEAPEGLPVVVQVFDRDRILFDGWWQTGAAFPASMLHPDAHPVPAPAWVDAPPGPAPVARARGGGARKAAPLLASAALLATSGLTYALAGQSAASMAELRTAEDLTAARSRANAFVVASGASLAGAVTVGVTVLASR